MAGDEDSFLSVPNMKHIIGGLSKFLLDKYAFTLSVDKDIRATILRAMEDVQSADPLLSLREKNRTILRVMRDVVVRRHELDEKAIARCTFANATHRRVGQALLQYHKEHGVQTHNFSAYEPQGEIPRQRGLRQTQRSLGS